MMGIEKRRRLLVPQLLAVLVVGMLSERGRADSWPPWPEQRIVDPRGRYYVVLKRAERRGMVTWLFAERAKGSPRVQPARENTRPRYEERNDPPVDVSVRAGDTVIAEGRLEQAPLHVFVPSSGWGFVALERYGKIGYGSSVVLVPRKGEPVAALKLTDLFDAGTIAAFPRTTSSIRWYGGAWIDEEMRDLVLVTKGGGVLRVVDLDTAQVRSGGEAEVRRGVRCEEPRGLADALELAVLLDLRGLEADLRRVFPDERNPLLVRLRAALLLARAGDAEGRSLLLRTATRPPEKGDHSYDDDRRFALEHLPEILGDDAIPLLLKIIQTETEGGRGATRALATYGERILPEMERILEEGAAHARYEAVSTLRAVASRRAMPLLLRAVRDEDDALANSAVNGAIRLWGTDIADELADLLRSGTTQDGRIAGYFEKNRYPEAVPALVAGLLRQTKGSYGRRRVIEALEFQTGESLGDDPEAWKEWLSSQGR